MTEIPKVCFAGEPSIPDQGQFATQNPISLFFYLIQSAQEPLSVSQERVGKLKCTLSEDEETSILLENCYGLNSLTLVLKNAPVICLVFSVWDKKSFDILFEKYLSIIYNVAEDASIVLLGLGLDIPCDDPIDDAFCEKIVDSFNSGRISEKYPNLKDHNKHNCHLTYYLLDYASESQLVKFVRLIQDQSVQSDERKTQRLKEESEAQETTASSSTHKSNTKKTFSLFWRKRKS